MTCTKFIHRGNKAVHYKQLSVQQMFGQRNCKLYKDYNYHIHQVIILYDDCTFSFCITLNMMYIDTQNLGSQTHKTSRKQT